MWKIIVFTFFNSAYIEGVHLDDLIHIYCERFTTVKVINISITSQGYLRIYPSSKFQLYSIF